MPEHTGSESIPSGASTRDEGLSQAAADLVSGRSDELYTGVEDAAVRPKVEVRPEQPPISAEQQLAELESVESAAVRDGRAQPLDSEALDQLVNGDDGIK